MKHYNPLLVTVLPHERRARHPYQLAAMICLLTLGAWQLVIGPVTVAATQELDYTAFALLNWACIVAGAAGLVAAVIPERIVRMQLPLRLFRRTFKTEFDATYFRLWEEFGCHLLLVSVWSAFGQATWANYGIAKGYSLGLAAAICFGGAALARAVQIFMTMWRARTFHRDASAIVGKTMAEKFPLDGEL